jgi:alginate O-acetyltransferase complex protein AlgI
MEIISWNFLIFTLVVLPAYYVLNRRAQNILLLCASLAFICFHTWINLFPLAVITGVTYYCGSKLKSPAGRTWLAAGLILQAGTFVFYRAMNSPMFGLSAWISQNGAPFFAEEWLVPLGFSFYILQAAGYLIDVYRNRLEPERDFIDFCLYLAFFPKFLAGPIERAGNFLPQLKHARTVNNDRLAQGLTLILFGLFRKVALAEVLLSILPAGILHTAVETAPLAAGLPPASIHQYAEAISYGDRLIGLIAYGIYLYNDFAGYTGIMRGISLLMGIELSPNFRQPYFSTSLSDFWSRWHISLTSWLRDYLYFPLTRCLKRRFNQALSPVPIVLPLVITMLAAGIWHGLTVPFLVWGLSYAVVMILEQWAFQRWPSLRPAQRNALYRVLAGLLTFAVVTLAWVPFTAGSWAEILASGRALLFGHGWNLRLDFSPWIPVLVCVSFLLDYLQARKKDELFLLSWPLLARASMLAVILFILFLAFSWTSPYTSNVFIYQTF